MKKNWLSTVGIIVGSCAPYAFLGMYGDAQWGTLWLYLMLPLGLGALWCECFQKKNLVALIGGNLVSAGVSLACVNGIRAERWSWYFKPFTGRGMVLLLSGAAILIQLLIWAIASRKK